MLAATFFEPGKTYIRSEPYKAPELLTVFRCVAVAEHPRKAESRAFGFLATVFPGDNWGSGARTPEDWGLGWSEYDKAGEGGEPATAPRADLNPELLDTARCLANAIANPKAHPSLIDDICAGVEAGYGPDAVVAVSNEAVAILERLDSGSDQ